MPQVLAEVAVEPHLLHPLHHLLPLLAQNAKTNIPIASIGQSKNTARKENGRSGWRKIARNLVKDVNNSSLICSCHGINSISFQHCFYSCLKVNYIHRYSYATPVLFNMQLHRIHKALCKLPTCSLFVVSKC